MIPRRILDDLRAWRKRKYRKPLVLRGARQVGKTTAVHRFGAEFRQFVPLNLDHARDREIFDQGLPLERTLEAIFFTCGADPAEADTLLFLDEVQSSSHAIHLLRDFAEQRPDLPVIAAGSLLEVALDRYRASFPVGRVEFLWLYPLNFAEYAVAAHEGSVEALARIPCPDHALPVLRRRFHDFSLVGGMPEIVSSWLARRDVGSLQRLYEGLLVSFTEDAGRYARSPAQLARFRHVLETAPLVAGERITYHGFGASNYRSREMGEALRTLERAMLLYLLHPTTSTEPPAVPDRRKSPKLLFLDAGLANYRAGLQAGLMRSEQLATRYRGRLMEHLVGLELLAADHRTAGKPRFWVRQRRGATAEVDFVHPYCGHLIPVEVKSGKSGALRSLHQFMERADHDLAVRLRDGPVHFHPARTVGGRKFRLLNLPFFVVHQLDAYLDWAERQPG